MKFKPFTTHWSVCAQQSEKKLIKFNESDQCSFFRREEEGNGGGRGCIEQN